MSSVFRYVPYLLCVFLLLYLFPDERHDSDACEDVLSGQTLAWNAICKSLRSIGPRLTKVTHEEGHVGPEDRFEGQSEDVH